MSGSYILDVDAGCDYGEPDAKQEDEPVWDAYSDLLAAMVGERRGDHSRSRIDAGPAIIVWLGLQVPPRPTHREDAVQEEIILRYAAVQPKCSVA